jgi:hypothetical protein
MAGEPITGRSGVSPLTGDREFESISLQRRVACEPEFSDLEGQADLAIAFSLLCREGDSALRDALKPQSTTIAGV